MEVNEKARKLVEKFIAHTYCNNNNELQCKEKSKQCALIVINEKINSLNAFSEYWDFKRGEWYKDELQKLEEVKQEIENL
jgi:hypothetical protein